MRDVLTEEEILDLLKGIAQDGTPQWSVIRAALQAAARLGAERALSERRIEELHAMLYGIQGDALTCSGQAKHDEHRK